MQHEQNASKCNSKVEKLSTSNLVLSSGEIRSAMLSASVKKKICTRTAILHSRLRRVVPMSITTMPLVMHVLLVFTNGTRFVNTKSLAVST